ncbi:MAG: hypothetical protein KAJ13_05735 [Gemmatimonadetes bacterium]|nr:hypothetical protein [Gemmatimonadota bacterium]MCK5483180.1 hypothetical protein [Gemmatimonadota bacterium]
MQLVVAPDLLVKLQVLADGLHKEIVLCLHGRVETDTAHVTSFTMPTPRRSEAAGASVEPCPREAVATWHNHPRPPPGIRAPRTAAAQAGDLCRLSDTDLRTASRSGHRYTLVAVDADNWCWWTLDEVRHLNQVRASQAAAHRVY